MYVFEKSTHVKNINLNVNESIVEKFINNQQNSIKKLTILQGFSAGHFSKVSPTLSIVRKAMLAIQDSMPFRLHQVIYINAPSFIGRILNIFYPLLKEKLIQKV